MKCSLSGGNKDNIRAGCKKCGYRKSVVSNMKLQCFQFMMLEQPFEEGAGGNKKGVCSLVAQTFFSLNYHNFIYLFPIHFLALHTYCCFWKPLSFTEENEVCCCVHIYYICNAVTWETLTWKHGVCYLLRLAFVLLLSLTASLGRQFRPSEVHSAFKGEII